MKYLLRAFSFLIVTVVVRGVLAFLSTSEKSREGQLRFSKQFAGIGIVCCVILLIPACLTAIDGEQIVLSAFFFICSFASAMSIVAFVNC